MVRLELGGLVGVRVLIVDDEPDARELLCHLLKHHGADATSAGSAGEAMTALAAGEYDVLLADLGMPIADGFSLITAVRDHQNPWVRRILAVAVTAFASDEARRRALVAGYDGYLTKPVEFDSLITYLTGLAGPALPTPSGRHA
jgi:CheY-like chemotaxis protein